MGATRCSVPYGVRMDRRDHPGAALGRGDRRELSPIGRNIHVEARLGFDVAKGPHVA